MLYESRFFFLVLGVVIAGFANGYMLLYQGRDPQHLGFGVSLVSQFQAALVGYEAVYRGDGEFDNVFAGESTLYNLQLIFFVVFVLLVNVLLLNLLIALSKCGKYVLWVCLFDPVVFGEDAQLQLAA